MFIIRKQEGENNINTQSCGADLKNVMVEVSDAALLGLFAGLVSNVLSHVLSLPSQFPNTM
jgi:hypothetical protein